MKHVTIKDIARSLCISVSTVSRALTDDKNIRRETREAVLREAERLGYRRNPVAMNLKMGRTNTIGVIVPEMHTPYASQVVAGIQSVLYKNNQKVMIAESDENPDRERESLQMMEEFMVDGLIVSLCSYKHNIETYRRLANEGVAIVFYDRIPHGMDDMPQVMVDDNNDSYFMAEHLIRLGCRRIAYLYGPDDVYNAVERGRGYREAMEKFQIYDPRLIVKTGMTFADGAAAVDSLVRQGIEFDAVYAFTDTLAIGAMNRLREKGRCIPEDVAVAGFSGTELSTIVFPQLTTVEPPLTEMGQRAAELVLEKVRNPEAENRKIVLRTEMKCRASTGE
ncbi:LacI family DNA-binding transcriptional regulator [Prevotella sp.]|uniref:LacI family DNA-binding transcriptional regulator n=1 Tax=Prevotella sp. TaxID=59823 RepID=UPI002E77F5DC|nr:LacI family DNA-binding transcriptional regulator [Prevotella sp.]MEE0670023.1 LacI family DNA-binding transcriptional regulator [Prevotella sp.]